MKHANCWDFLCWALPRMGFAPRGFRRVRGQVCKRLARRLKQLGLGDLAAYRRLLASDDAEWRRLDAICRITVTRFFRERGRFERLQHDVLPRLAAAATAERRRRLRAWSAGCGGGEEPFTLSIIWELAIAPAYPALALEISATDADPDMLRRAARATYAAGTLRELPAQWLSRAFRPVDGRVRLRPEFRQRVRFDEQDIREAMPAGRFDLVLCRYLAFTYFDEAGQRAVLRGIARRLRPGGILMIGDKEDLPSPACDFLPFPGDRGLWQRAPAA